MRSFVPQLPAKSIPHLSVFLVCMLFLSACGSGSDTNPVAETANSAVRAPEPETVKDGYNALFIGHSFFRPVAEGMPSHAARAGVEDHTQEVVFSGGASGSPQGLWENAAKRATIQSILDARDIELFGMTYHPSFPGLEGYINWVEYALARNPRTKFFVALPWPTNPSTMDSGTYESILIDGHPVFHSGIIEALRAAYPDNEFFCIPYGEASVELYKLYAQGNLPDVDTLITSADDLGIYKDLLGHPEAMLVDLSQLVWLQAIYAVDLGSYNYDPVYFTDLMTTASDIMSRHDSAYDDK